MTDDQRQWAIRRVRAKRAFWVHLTVYVLVNALLVFIWAVSSGGYFWPAWPMFGWGIGLVAHAVRVFLAPMDVSEERIDRELQGRSGSRLERRDELQSAEQAHQEHPGKRDDPGSARR